ncbi:MAG: hypothetical protein R2755_00560 [Acidimicrobiales bacterium]
MKGTTALHGSPGGAVTSARDATVVLDTGAPDGRFSAYDPMACAYRCGPLAMLLAVAVAAVSVVVIAWSLSPLFGSAATSGLGGSATGTIGATADPPAAPVVLTMASFSSCALDPAA